MTSNCAVSFSSTINTFTIQASAGAGGSIYPSGSVSVNYNASQSFTATPAAGYNVSGWLLDNADAGCGFNTTCVIDNVTAGHTLTVSFVQQFAITPSTLGNCSSISPSSQQFVTNGQNSPQFSASASTGYSVIGWNVDGFDYPSCDGSTTCTLTNVTTNHSLAARCTVTVGGSVSGVNRGEQLQLVNNGQTIILDSTQTSFTFNPQDPNTSYDIQITEPSGQLCNFVNGNGSGPFNGQNVTNASISCSENPDSKYKIGGKVSGLLNNGSVTLLNNGTDELEVQQDGKFTFSTPLENGSEYQITVSASPLHQSCSVTVPENGIGYVAGEDITSIVVDCTLDLPFMESFRNSSTNLSWESPGQNTSTNWACLTASNIAGTSTDIIYGCANSSYEGQQEPSGQPQPCGGSTSLYMQCGWYDAASNTIDEQGNGSLKLTDYYENKEGGVIFNYLFPMTKGLTIQFTAYSYGWGYYLPADGISFFLIDGTSGTIPTALGPFGGGLGYGNNRVNGTSNGAAIANGYIGVGFDEYGNFAEAVSTGNNPIPDRIAIRGPTGDTSSCGTNACDNQLLKATDQLSPSLSSTSNPLLLRNLVVDESTGRNVYKVEVTSACVVTVSRNNDQIIQTYDVPANTGVPCPPTVYLGYAASTGIGVSVHEITDMIVDTPDAFNSVNVVLTNTNGNQVTITNTMANNNVDSMTQDSDGTYTLPTSLVEDSTYSVAATLTASGQSCTIGTNGSGTMPDSDITVTVDCGSSE
ncbi:hypothetical protein BN59_02045 [Legionella massiliensis]|uniref:Bacterial repeat domain-containing protein n=1 Tax=Legionella massiliensis TaxID=1034943 RepID=A0A078KTE5_9GAMM|nr:hypothetical protein [Legionella massiliensis]CDZ77755.1 hypothetical protein BN59_02045 [Legionella massiliensis]CEE13493.1 hypothetical protein BN1094_02045 [Legionella massiliensis]